MRIISGRFKGRKLLPFKGEHIRPTTDRVKGSIFNSLQGVWDNARVLDLFSGTGNLSIEALSWGAREVTAVEAHPKSVQILKRNLDALSISSKEIKIVKQDVFDFIKSAQVTPFDIILADPPFTEKLAHSTLQALSKSALWTSSTQIVIEFSRHEALENEYGPLTRIDTKTFGDKLVAVFSERNSP